MTVTSRCCRLTEACSAVGARLCHRRRESTVRVTEELLGKEPFRNGEAINSAANHPLADRAMCSVSFLPHNEGFVLAMNRDESRSRPSALPPEVVQRDELAMLYPRELNGGTWVGINSAGMAFALINWYSQPDCGDCNAVSRGEVVRTLLAAAAARAPRRCSQVCHSAG